MQDFKHKAKESFVGRETRSIFIPEWGATIYFKKPNLATFKAAMVESNREPLEMQARMVVACATDAEGKKIWNSAEYVDLMTSYDPDVVSRIADAIMNGTKLATTAQEQAEDEKNS